MTLEELDAIEARAKAATEGSWIPKHHNGPARDHEVITPDRKTRVCWVEVDPGGEAAADADVEFICAARSNVPALVAEVRRLHAEIERIQNAHEAEMEDRNWRETE